jgi:hypothetical protein
MSPMQQEVDVIVREFEEEYAAAFGRKDAKALSENVIVSHGTSHKIGEWGAGEERLSYTRVLVREGGEWRLAATQVAPSSSMPDPRTSRTAEGCG